MLRAVVGAIFTLLVAFGGPAVWWYDRRPPDVPKPIAFRVLFWPVKIGLPLSLRAQNADTRAQLAIAVTNEKLLTSVLLDQNSRVRAISAAGVVARAKAENATRNYLSALGRLSRPEAAIIAAGSSSPGSEACTRAQAVDDLFMRSLP